MSKYDLNVSYFKEINNPTKAFWLGFICADGSIKSNRGTPYLKIAQDNDVLLNKFREDISFTGEVKYITKSQKGRYSDKPFYELTVYGGEFSNAILNLGKTRYKKDLKEIPKLLPNEYIPDFIRGYFEGDGSLYYANANSSWCFSISGVYELLKEMKAYLGIGNIYGDKSISKLMASGNGNVDKFVEKVYYNDNVYGIKHKPYKEWLNG